MLDLDASWIWLAINRVSFSMPHNQQWQPCSLFNLKDYNGKFGLMVYNKTNQLTKKGRNDNPINEWVIVIGKHKGFWTGKEYVEV